MSAFTDSQINLILVFAELPVKGDVKFAKSNVKLTGSAISFVGEFLSIPKSNEIVSLQVVPPSSETEILKGNSSIWQQYIPSVLKFNTGEFVIEDKSINGETILPDISVEAKSVSVTLEYELKIKKSSFKFVGQPFAAHGWAFAIVQKSSSPTDVHVPLSVVNEPVEKSSDHITSPWAFSCFEPFFGEEGFCISNKGDEIAGLLKL